jgi:hypothetical protein
MDRAGRRDRRQLGAGDRQGLSWRGDFSESDLDADTIWDRVGAEPIEIVVEDVIYFTVRGYGARSGGDARSSQAEGADLRSDDDEVLFLGEEGNVAVFTEVADLANYCRTATEHELVHLEWWGELAEVDDDEIFRPAVDASYVLTTPSEKSAELLRELIEFCRLDLEVPDLSMFDEDEDDAEDADARLDRHGRRGRKVPATAGLIRLQD